ncbi:MAG: hypothetical protein ACG0KC_01785 [Enterobacteriaceae bacterium]
MNINKIKMIFKLIKKFKISELEISEKNCLIRVCKNYKENERKEKNILKK